MNNASFNIGDIIIDVFMNQHFPNKSILYMENLFYRIERTTDKKQTTKKILGHCLN